MEELKKLIQEANEKGLIRSFTVDRDTINVEERTAEFSILSDKPIKHYFGYLKLRMEESAIIWDRFKDGAAFRDTHFGDQIGVIENSWIDKQTGKLRVKVRFSNNTDRAIEVFSDIKDGIRRNVSARFDIVKMELIEENEEGLNTYEATLWEPIHGSMEADGADFSVGIDRNKEEPAKPIEENKLNNIKSNYKESNQMDEKERLELERQQAEAVKAAKAAGQKDREQQVLSIFSIARNMQPQLKGLDLTAEATKFVKEGKTDRDFWAHVEAKVQDPAAVQDREVETDLGQKDLKAYSITRAMAYKLGLISEDKAGLELEVSRDLEDKLNQAPKGLFIPKQVLQRDMSVAGSNVGSQLVGTDHLPGKWIDLLRNKALVARLGATFLSGLEGNVSIPKWASAATAAWTSTEGAGAAESTPGTGALTLSPKEISANVDYTRQLMLQSDPSVDMLIKNDLIKVLALGVDLAALHGSGASGQPQGIVGTSGVGSVALATHTNAHFIEFETDVDTSNALDGSFNFITTPAIRGTLKGSPKVSGYPTFICSENNVVNGYPMHTSNQVSSGYVFFGDMTQIVIAEWGSLDLYPVLQARTGIVTITAFKTVDIGIRQAGAFSVGSLFS